LRGYARPSPLVNSKPPVKAGGVAGGYEALLSSTQVVAGLNFRFIGTETLATLQADKYPVLFTVYWPHSGGTPVFTGAQKVYDLV
jgi:hypothetical protein